MTTATYMIYSGDPRVAGGSEYIDEEVTVEVETLQEALGDVRDAMEIEAAGLSPEDGWAPGDRLYAMVWHDGGSECLEYVVTAEDLG